MIHELKIYGASDDLIEVEGDLNEEFNHYSSNDDKGVYLAVSDGTLLFIRYDEEGIWRIKALVIAPGTKLEKTEGTSIPDTGTDVVTLTREAPFNWLVLGEASTHRRNEPDE